MNTVVGVLTLQGAYQKHIELLHSMGVTTQSVRQPQQLENCSALIIPGGESTTISLLVQEYGLYDLIRSFAAEHPVMGVCAGMIMLANEVDDARVKPLGLMPFKATRNHFGRQVNSFTADIQLDFAPNDKPFHAHFIRAPGFENISPEIEVLARYQDEVVMIGTGKHMALSFHPELTSDIRIHQHWLHNINQ
jgi:5'-phosphate synthase pdxT subunit